VVQVKYRALFISDIHIGTGRSQVDKAVDFICDKEFDYIYLVGDIIDGVALKRKEPWHEKANDFLQNILKKAKEGTQIIYITGNHDKFLEDFWGNNFGGIKITEKTLHNTKDGKCYMVIHGHQFHTIFLHFILSLKNWVKDKNKQISKFRAGIENNAICYAAKSGVDGIICGHTHEAKIRVTNNITYINTGDCVESLTCVVENKNGELELIDIAK
jgi:putative phosphoesterase